MNSWNEVEAEFEKSFARDITGLCIYADVRDVKFFLKETADKAYLRGREETLEEVRRRHSGWKPTCGHDSEEEKGFQKGIQAEQGQIARTLDSMKDLPVKKED